MEKKQLPRKHAGKKTTSEQETIIETIKGSKNMNSWNLMPRVKNTGLTAEYNIIKKEEMPAIAAITGDEKPKKRATMTVAETKLGVTMVINKEEIAMLGIDINKTTKEAIQELRIKLGLKTKGVKE